MNWQSSAIIVAMFVAYFIVKSISEKAIARYGRARGVAVRRIKYVTSTISILLFVVCLTAVAIVLGINHQDIGFIFSSVMAVLGVALFAQWSILSNVTASLIVFFFFPYRVGDTVKVLDGDNSVEGVIEEINLFHILLIDAEKKCVTFPNSLAFQKSIVITLGSGSRGEFHGE